MLSGGSTTSGKSDIGETIRIFNTSATTLSFHLFQYSDFDLGDAGNDTVQLGRNIRGLFNEASQTDINGAGLTETVVTPGANHGEVAFFADTLNHLNSGTAYNLNDNSGPVGPGDVTWALQWDFNIAPGGSAIVSKDKYLQIAPVPEPAVMALAGLGLLLCVFRKRTS